MERQESRPPHKWLESSPHSAHRMQIKPSLEEPAFHLEVKVLANGQVHYLLELHLAQSELFQDILAVRADPLRRIRRPGQDFKCLLLCQLPRADQRSEVRLSLVDPELFREDVRLIEPCKYRL